MNPLFSRIAVIFLFQSLMPTAFGQATPSPAQPIAVITVCEALKNLSLYNGKPIVIVGRLGGTFEGSWLSENCDSSLITDGYTWSNIISTSYLRSETEPPPPLPQNFKWDKELLQSKLKQLQATTRLRDAKTLEYSDKWVAIFGRFEARLPLRTAVAGDGKPRGYGFGHLNAAPAQLISHAQGYRELKYQ